MCLWLGVKWISEFCFHEAQFENLSTLFFQQILKTIIIQVLITTENLSQLHKHHCSMGMCFENHYDESLTLEYFPPPTTNSLISTTNNSMQFWH